MTNPSKNSFFMFATFIIGALTNYAFNVGMCWLLTPEQYGMLGVCVSFLIIFSLFVTSAFPLTVTRFISSENEESVKHRVFKSALFANVTIAIILSILFYFVYYTGMIKLGANYNLLVISIIITTIFTSAMVVHMSILQGTFRFRSFGAIGAITALIKLISGVILVYLGLGALGAVLSLTISVFVGLILAVILTKDFRFLETKGWAGSNVYFFALPMFFGTLGTTLLMNIDILGVKFLTEEALSDMLSGYYRAALILAQIPIFVVGTLMSVMFPYISRHTVNNKYASKSIKYATLFILPMALVIAASPDAFISLMFPSEYLAASKALGVVAIGMGLLVLAMVFTFIFQARHKQKIPATVLSIAVIIEIFSLIYLVPSYGIIGAATSTTIACTSGFALLAIQYIRIYRCKLDHIAIIKTLVSFCILIFLIFILPYTGTLSFIGNLVLSTIIYLVALAFFNLLTQEDVSIFFSGLPAKKSIISIEQIILRFINVLNR